MPYEVGSGEPITKEMYPDDIQFGEEWKKELVRLPETKIVSIASKIIEDKKLEIRKLESIIAILKSKVKT